MSDTFVNQAYRGGGDPVLTLLRVNIDGTLYYFVNNTESIQSNVSGITQTYQRGMFNISLPEDKDSDSAPSATIQFETGDIQTVRALRSANNRILIDLWVVLASAPNIVEFGPSSFESGSVDISANSVSMSLVSEPILDVQFPGYRFTPELFPALWESGG
jgi:hypothetical protein